MSLNHGHLLKEHPHAQTRFFSTPLLTALTISGCGTYGSHEEAGSIIGGILGGVLGTQVGKGHGRTVAIIAGALAGSAIGGSIGKHMDDNDRAKVAQTLEGVKTDVPVAWSNPDTGVQYSVTPTRTYEAVSGPCREFTTEAIIDGKREAVYGTACRQTDGSWKIQNS